MTGALALVAALSVAGQIQVHPTGLKSVGLSHGRAGVRTVQILDKLYEQAGKPSLDFDFARYGDLHDNATGETSLVTFSRPASQSPGTYVGSDGLIKTAAVNLALYSEQFDQWTNSNTTDAANQTDAPDGKQTADTITATGANGTITRGVTTTAINYTFSVYIKRKTGTGDIDISADGSTWVTQSVTSDWQRFSVTQTGVAGTSNPGVRLVTSGDEVYIWGAQLEEGTTPTPYIKTTSQALAAPRFDHDPVTGESLGLLVEEQRTNLQRYSENFNTYYTILGIRAFGAGSIVDAIDSPDGQTTADFVQQSTSTSGHAILLTSSSVSSGATYTTSFYAKYGGHRYVGVYADASSNGGAVGPFGGTFNAVFDLENNVVHSTDTASGIQSKMSDAGNGWFRCSITWTATGTGTVEFGIYQVDSDGVTVSYTGDGTSGVYLWGAQLEEGAFPTSYIPTTTSAQTRFADVAAVEGADFSSFYNATEGTIYAIASSAGTGTRGIAGIDDNTANERIELQTDGTDPEFVVIDGGAGSTLDTGTITADTFFNLAGAYKNNDLAATVGGLPVQTATDTVPTVDRMRIGALQASGTYLNGHIRRLTYWPVRQPDATLQVITQ